MTVKTQNLNSGYIFGTDKYRTAPSSGSVLNTNGGLDLSVVLMNFSVQHAGCSRWTQMQKSNLSASVLKATCRCIL